MSDTETSTLPSRIAALNADTTTIHGVAIAAGDVTRGLENTRKVWPVDALRAAAQSLAGADVTVLHSEQAAGEVVRSGYDDERDAVVYEADLTDDKLAEQVRNGQADVSIEARHSDGGEHEDTGAMLATDIEFTGLSIVQHGAAPSNSAEHGPAQALAARLSAADIEATLNGYQSTSGVRYRGTRDGKLDESALPSDDFEGHYLFDGDTKSASSYPVVDADGYLRRGNVAAAYSVGPRGDVTRDSLYDKLRPLNEAFLTPPIAADKLDASAAATLSALADDLQDAHREHFADADPPAADDGMAPEDAGPNADTTDTSMSDDDTPDSEHDVDALLSRIDEKDERIGDLESTIEAQTDEINEVKRAYASALANSGPFDEDTLVDKFEVAELRERFDDLDADLADPDPEPDVQSGAGESGQESANLSAAEKEKAENLEARAARWEQRGNETAAEKLREKATTIRGEN